MKQRKLGKSGLKCPRSASDAWGQTFSYGHALDRQQAIDLIRGRSNAGVTFFRHRRVYGRSRTKSWSARRVAPFAAEVVIATKFGWRLDPETGKQIGTDSRPELGY